MQYSAVDELSRTNFELMVAKANCLSEDEKDAIRYYSNVTTPPNRNDYFCAYDYPEIAAKIIPNAISRNVLNATVTIFCNRNAKINHYYCYELFTDLGCTSACALKNHKLDHEILLTKLGRLIGLYIKTLRNEIEIKLEKDRRNKYADKKKQVESFKKEINLKRREKRGERGERERERDPESEKQLDTLLNLLTSEELKECIYIYTRQDFKMKKERGFLGVEYPEIAEGIFNNNEYRKILDVVITVLFYKRPPPDKKFCQSAFVSGKCRIPDCKKSHDMYHAVLDNERIRKDIQYYFSEMQRRVDKKKERERREQEEEEKEEEREREEYRQQEAYRREIEETNNLIKGIMQTLSTEEKREFNKSFLSRVIENDLYPGVKYPEISREIITIEDIRLALNIIITMLCYNKPPETNLCTSLFTRSKCDLKKCLQMKRSHDNSHPIFRDKYLCDFIAYYIVRIREEVDEMKRKRKELERHEFNHSFKKLVIDHPPVEGMNEKKYQFHQFIIRETKRVLSHNEEESRELSRILAGGEFRKERNPFLGIRFPDIPGQVIQTPEAEIHMLVLVSILCHDTSFPYNNYCYSLFTNDVCNNQFCRQIRNHNDQNHEVFYSQIRVDVGWFIKSVQDRFNEFRAREQEREREQYFASLREDPFAGPHLRREDYMYAPRRKEEYAYVPRKKEEYVYVPRKREEYVYVPKKREENVDFVPRKKEEYAYVPRKKEENVDFVPEKKEEENVVQVASSSLARKAERNLEIDDDEYREKESLQEPDDTVVFVSAFPSNSNNSV